MAHDRFDRFLLFVSLSALIAFAVVIKASNTASAQHNSSKDLNKALEREMNYRARIELINKLYGPVENLRKDGHKQEALLKLDEINRLYPGEAHGHILQGQILWEMEAADEAVSAFVDGVKLNGDYVDDKSPLSQRADIQRLVNEETKSIAARSVANPGNSSLSALIQKNNYLKSRLAGGCE